MTIVCHSQLKAVQADRCVSWVPGTVLGAGDPPAGESVMLCLQLLFAYLTALGGHGLWKAGSVQLTLFCLPGISQVPDTSWCSKIVG